MWWRGEASEIRSWAWKDLRKWKVTQKKKAGETYKTNKNKPTKSIKIIGHLFSRLSYSNTYTRYFSPLVSGHTSTSTLTHTYIIIITLSHTRTHTSGRCTN